jgi:hypothetical protein
LMSCRPNTRAMSSCESAPLMSCLLAYTSSDAPDSFYPRTCRRHTTRAHECVRARLAGKTQGRTSSSSSSASSARQSSSRRLSAESTTHTIPSVCENTHNALSHSHQHTPHTHAHAQVRTCSK